MINSTKGSLDGALTIHSAAAQHAKLLEMLDAGLRRLDLAAVTECDAAGLQLLLALRRSVAASGQVLRLEQPSQALTEALRCCGLTDLLDTSTSA